MRFPLIAAVASARPHLSFDLVDVPSFAGLSATAARLPPVATSFGFECRLGPSPRVDLGISVEPGNGGRAALADLGSAAADAAPAEATRALHPAWVRVRSFARAWNGPTTAVHHWVPFTFLELDADSDAVPSVFAALDWPLDPDALPHLRRAAADVLALLLERDSSAAVERCFEALPRFARVLHVGAMLSRAGRAARFSASIPREFLREYLTGVGLAVDPRPLEETLDRVEHGLAAPYPWRPRQVDFDAGDARAPIGVNVRPLDASQWPDLLAALVDAGLCLAAKRDALLAWPGTGEAEIGAPCRVVRQLSHVKVALRADASLEAKVYLGATPRFGA